MQYRRNHSPRGVYFFTVVTKERKPLLDKPIVLAALREAIVTVRKRHPFKTDAIVVLPDHLHCIWTLSGEDGDFSRRWRLIKAKVTRSLGYNPWQSRFWEHQIRNQVDLNRHVDYIHYNPVKHGLVERAEDWQYSSIHRYVREGLDSSWESLYVPDESIGRE